VRRPLRPAVALLFTAILLLAACQPAGSESPGGSGVPQPSSGATGGTVRIGYGGSPDSLNPGLALLSEAYQMFELVYDTPLTVLPDGSYVGELATDWEISDDGLTYTLHLVDNAVFHDGTPMTSEDVKFSLELYRDNPEFPYMSSYPDVFTSIEAPDPTTVVMTSESPIGNFEYRMIFMYVLPMHIWENEDPLSFANEEMIGTGSFMMAEYAQNEFVRLAANKDHFNIVPLVDELIFQTIENGDARVAAITNGEIDMITEFPTTAMPTLEAAENVQVVVSDSIASSLTDIFFNVADPDACPGPSDLVPDGGVCSGHPAIRDVEVRQALASATNKQELLDVATFGLGTLGVSLVPPGQVDFFVGADAGPTYDVDAANQQLDDAGYEDGDGDGIRECLPDQDCEDLTFRLSFPDDSDSGPREAELIQAQWEEVGVAVEITTLDADTLTSICCPAFDYDVIMWGWGPDPDPSFLLGVTLCDNIENGFNETGYCNPDYDDLFEQQATEPDHEARVEIIHQMQEILLEDVPYIIPYYYGSTQAYRTDAFTGWNTDELGFGLDDITSLGFIRPVE
jgi:peptide/nickel transport system substrate-binding protein